MHTIQCFVLAFFIQIIGLFLVKIAPFPFMEDGGLTHVNLFLQYSITLI